MFAEIFVDGFTRLGSLTYSIPVHLSVNIGDAVKVPFGKREATGVVFSLRDSAPKVTNIKPIMEVYGARSTEADIVALAQAAKDSISDVKWAIPALAPTTNKGAVANRYGTPRLHNNSLDVCYSTARSNTMCLLRPPQVPPEELAAYEASRLYNCGEGQVLILCPTKYMAECVEKQFSDGAALLEGSSWASFRDGLLPIGIGTQEAAWFSAKNIAALVVAEEDDPAHKASKAPYIDSREVARVRTAGKPLTLTSSNPTANTLGIPGLKVEVVETKRPVSAVKFYDRTIDSTDIPPELYLLTESLAKEGKTFHVVKTGTTVICAICGTPSLHNICDLCDSDKQTTIGFGKSKIRKVYGDAAKPVEYRDLLKVKSSPLVIIPAADSSLHKASLQPGIEALQILSAAIGATSPSGLVFAITSGVVPSSLKSFSNGDSLELAKTRYFNAKALRLPPFGRILKVQVSTPKVDIDKLPWPGILHGPIHVGSNEQFILRFSSSDISRVKHCLAELRKQSKKLIVLN